jgi:hypothetical protein
LLALSTPRLPLAKARVSPGDPSFTIVTTRHVAIRVCPFDAYEAMNTEFWAAFSVRQVATAVHLDRSPHPSQATGVAWPTSRAVGSLDLG